MTTRNLAALAAALTTLALAAPAAAAAAAAAYAPTGPLVADSGFRPDTNGYSFPNYGHEGAKDLAAPQMVKLFGRKACENATGRCKLTTVARGWMRSVNQSMAGGHCMGFAVTSELFHAGLGTPATPSLIGGSETAFGLPRDPKVMRHIAYGFAFQNLPSVQAQSQKVDARRLIARLRELLPSTDEAYTLGIFKRDHTGGHAITPYAIEDRGNGRYAVLVYDNNYPGVTRAMHVDVKANTWSYEASINPEVDSDIYDGDSKVSNLELMPATPGLGEQDCFFCRASADSGKPKMNLMWAGDPRTHEHGNLVIRDRKGRQSGCGDFGNGFECRNRIPGVEQHSLYLGGQLAWLQSATPTYELPYGRPYSIALTGAELRKPAREGFALIGKGRYVGVAGVKLSPGETDVLHVARGARQVVFENDPHQAETPRIQLGVEAKKASYLFELKARNVREGAAVGFRLSPKRRRVLVLGEDVKGTGRYQIKAIRQNARGRTVRTREIVVRSGEVIQIQYGDLLGKRKQGRRKSARG